MRNTLIVFFVLIAGSVVLAQNKTTLDQEEVHLTLSDNTVFAGETLYYKANVFLGDLQHYSALSKVLYVKIIDADKNVIHEQKSQITNGKAQGDIFIKTAVPSGNYKLVAYTQWMLNASAKHFFQTDLVIVNPYLGDQKGFTESNISKAENVDLKPIAAQEIDLKISTHKIGNRKKVTLDITPKTVGLREDFTLTVKRVDPFFKQDNDAIIAFAKRTSMFQPVSKQSADILPELRGEIIEGSISSDERSVNNITLGLSFPQDRNTSIYTTKTDANGTFKFVVDKPFAIENAVVNPLENAENYEVKLSAKAQPDFSDLSFASFKLTPDLKKQIEQRSVANQIENAYFTKKPDTIITPPSGQKFYGAIGETFALDDYTRFKTVKETFVEVVEYASLRSKDGKPVFKVQVEDKLYYEDNPAAMVIVDGIILEDHAKLVEYPAALIDDISVIRSKYFFGPKLFYGIIDVKTKDGDFAKRYLSYNDHAFTQQPVALNKQYYKQSYASGADSRIPDYRYLLAWEPNFNVAEKDEYSFYTSDVDGVFEVSLKGFTKNGDSIVIKEYIEVN